MGTCPNRQINLYRSDFELAMVNDLKNDDLQQFSDLAQLAAEKAGIHLANRLGDVEIREKSPADFVTSADFESQRLIHDLINSKFPDHDFLGEETDDSLSSSSASEQSDFCWIVDPLDGTMNYIHQLRSFSVSIGLRYKDQLVAGCVHDPILKETYHATLGGGAFLNDKPIKVSKQTTTKNSMLVCSLPSNLNRDSKEMTQLVNVICDANATVRRLGSTALNLCFIACGRIDAYWSTKAKIWDVAAGIIILTEAGGQICHITGGEFDMSDIRFVAASTDGMRTEMIDLLQV